MATRRGPPKHQNATTWVPNRADKHNSQQQMIKQLPLADGVCSKCRDVIEWKRKYGKYKALKQPAKCLGCTQRTVQFAYHQLCRPCANSKKVCAKCMQKPAAAVQQQADKSDPTEDALALMSERQKRTAQRHIANGTWDGATLEKSASQAKYAATATVTSPSPKAEGTTLPAPPASDVADAADTRSHASNPLSYDEGSEDDTGGLQAVAQLAIAEVPSQPTADELADNVDMKGMSEEEVERELDAVLETACSRGFISESQLDEITDQIACGARTQVDVLHEWWQRVGSVLAEG